MLPFGEAWTGSLIHRRSDTLLSGGHAEPRGGRDEAARTAGALILTQSLGRPLEGYFYYHGVRGTLLRQLGCIDEAREAFGRALALVNTPAEAKHIREQLEHLQPGPAEPPPQ